MDLSSRLLTWLEDRIELPRHLEIRERLAKNAGSMRTMGFVCREQAERIPDRTALRFEDETFSYAAYNEGVNRYAQLLRARGVAQGDVVNVMMENSADFLMAQGACAKLGAIGALINHHIEGEGLVHVHRISGARVALVDAGGAPALLRVAGELEGIEVHADLAESGTPFRPLREELAEAPTAEPDIPEISLGDVFLYVYTSGTTGFPKPAIVRHIRFTAGGHSLALMMDVGQDDCSYAPTPLYHGWANFVGFSPTFHVGGCFSSRRRFSASEFLDDVRRHDATIFCYVGELCRYLMRQRPTEGDRDHSIRLATGAGLRPDIWADFQKRFGIEKIIDTYGQTEGNVSLQNRRGRVGSVGRCVPGTHDDLRLARYDHVSGELARGQDGFLVECRVGEPGELLSRMRGSSGMPFDGYANRKENEKKILKNGFEQDDRWIRTGDLLKRDRASYYYFVDRIGDTFRWKGENVATMEVEHLLNATPGVHETAVYGVRVADADGRAGMAAVVPEDPEHFDPAALLEQAARTLPRYAQPLFVRVCSALEITGNYKNRKLRFQEEGFDPTRVEDPLYFRDDVLGRYVPLDEALYADLLSGRARI